MNRGSFLIDSSENTLSNNNASENVFGICLVNIDYLPLVVMEEVNDAPTPVDDDFPTYLLLKNKKQDTTEEASEDTGEETEPEVPPKEPELKSSPQEIGSNSPQSEPTLGAQQGEPEVKETPGFGSIFAVAIVPNFDSQNKYKCS